MIDRRTSLKLTAAGAAVLIAPRVFARPAAPGLRWMATTRHSRWQPLAGQPTPPAADMFEQHVQFALDRPALPIDGFGRAFSEKGWDALSSLPSRLRDEAMGALFGEGGAAFNLCRTPIGANVISRGWYSYDESPGDFALDHFSIANDRETLIPFIKAAQAVRPDVRLWASPWSTPTWMKRTSHYAQAPAWPGRPSKASGPTRSARRAKIRSSRMTAISTPTPAISGGLSKNTPVRAFASAWSCRSTNSIRLSPSPVVAGRPRDSHGSSRTSGARWTRLAPKSSSARLNVVTLTFSAKCWPIPLVAPLIKGVGVQRAGKGALEEIARRHPGLPIWGSEQECGFGDNSWRYARYGWTTIRRYFNAGARAWHYWNMAMPLGGLSGWGWPQNALHSVDTRRGRFELTIDYWMLRHLSAFVKPGARLIPNSSFMGFENQLAFRNPDGELVIVIQNDDSTPQSVRLMIGKHQLTPRLPADSFNTIVVPKELLTPNG